MIFRYIFRNIVLIRLVLGGSLDSIYLMWFSLTIILLIRLYSHLRFILLILELITVIFLILLLFLGVVSGFELRFLFLFLCLAVGEACLGLGLLVITSRFQTAEIIRLNLF